jgi:hypothetical protein
VDPANPTIGNLSAFYSQQLGLWLMTYDGGRGSDTTVGAYLTYAPQPWGPWSTPQRIFNDCRDKALGNFIFYYYATAAGNYCPTAMPAGVTSAPNSAGPAGPTINPANNVPRTTRGGGYAPQMVQRFTEISGNTLKIFYTLSTWNPYAVVLMESDFTIAYGPVVSLVVNAEGGGAAIAPNTWVQINGAGLAPAGDSRTWQSSDFANGKLPTQLDGVSVTVNGQSAYVYYISPTQVNILTPPDAISGPVQIVATNNRVVGAAFTAQAQPTSPSFFVFNGGPYVAAVHANGSLIGPATLYPGSTTPATPVSPWCSLQMVLDQHRPPSLADRRCNPATFLRCRLSKSEESQPQSSSPGSWRRDNINSTLRCRPASPMVTSRLPLAMGVRPHKLEL